MRLSIAALADLRPHGAADRAGGTTTRMDGENHRQGPLE
ncbi:hypothetical protein HMPREF0682_0532 [Propionibacterium acidifaciens F0233]|uniref:Uncharacterized protein n=1 Tax=Propionibacterium acidifaciens F0233 TaxID=553198 RepID=U2RPV8_9ACTN|nr:hypothetical protein HMPREF0682_0532 [Propionibacterium acidifaciens F0233]